ATIENGEPMYCGYTYQSVWYKLKPTTDTWLRGNWNGSNLYYPNLSVYRDTGGGLFGLNFVACSGSTYPGTSVTFLARPGSTYYIQTMAPCCFGPGTVITNLERIPPPQPLAAFSYNPYDPSTFDLVGFYDTSTDSGQVGIQTRAWNFGDGGTGVECCPQHTF